MVGATSSMSVPDTSTRSPMTRSKKTPSSPPCNRLLVVTSPKSMLLMVRIIGIVSKDISLETVSDGIQKGELVTSQGGTSTSMSTWFLGGRDPM